MIITKVLGGALAGSLILSGLLGLMLATTRAELSSAKKWQGQMVTAVGLASGNPDVTKGNAQAQVQQLGQLRVELKQSIAGQNAAIQVLEQKTAQAHVLFERERQYRKVAIGEAEAARDHFNTLVETTVPKEEMEARIREMQDELYEAGL